MNLKEGTRRLALLLGMIGLILGGFVSYFQLQSTMSQKANHQRFERAAVRIEQLGKKTQEAYPVYKDIDAGDLGWRVLVKYPQFWPWVSGSTTHQPELPKPWETYQAEQTPQPGAPATPMFAPDGTLRWIPNSMLDRAMKSGGQQAVLIVDPDGTERWAPQGHVRGLLKAGAKLAPAGDSQKMIDARNAANHSALSEKADYDWRTLGIQTPSGQRFYPTPAPSAWSYLLIAILPILGFFIPWGAVRAVGWVVAGFV